MRFRQLFKSTSSMIRRLKQNQTGEIIIVLAQIWQRPMLNQGMILIQLITQQRRTNMICNTQLINHGLVASQLLARDSPKTSFWEATLQHKMPGISFIFRSRTQQLLRLRALPPATLRLPITQRRLAKRITRRNCCNISQHASMTQVCSTRLSLRVSAIFRQKLPRQTPHVHQSNKSLPNTTLS